MKLTKAQVQIQQVATNTIRRVFREAMEKEFPLGMKFCKCAYPERGTYKIVEHLLPSSATINEEGEVSANFTQGWIRYRKLDKRGWVRGETYGHPMSSFWIAFKRVKD